MNFEFFAFLVFMSFTSFAIAFLAYGMVVRFMGKESFASRMAQIVLVPACIVIYDFITIASPSGYRYWVGGAPLLLCAGIVIYYRFIKGEDFNHYHAYIRNPEAPVKAVRIVITDTNDGWSCCFQNLKIE